MVKNFICNKYGGIRQKTAQFSENVITCSDMQNVELFYTGVNSGVGIRTSKGQTSIKELPTSERIVNIFESVQQGKNNCFIHTISENENVYELTDGTNIAYTPIFGYANNKFPDNEVIYKESDCANAYGNLTTALNVTSSNSGLVINNNYIGTKDVIGTEVKTFEYKEVYNYDKEIVTYYGDLESNFDKFTGGLNGFSSQNKLVLNDLNYNLFSGNLTYPSSKGVFKEIGDCRECQITLSKFSNASQRSDCIQIVINGIISGAISISDFWNSKTLKLGKIKTYRDEYFGEYYVYLEIKWEDEYFGEKSIDIPIWGGRNETIGVKLTQITSMLFQTAPLDIGTISLTESYIIDNDGNKRYLAEKIGEDWFENQDEVDFANYSIEVLGTPVIGDTLTLTYNTKQVLLNEFTYTGNTVKGFSKLYLYDFPTEKLIPKITGMTRQTISSGVDYKQGYDDCFIFCNKNDNLYKIQLDKTIEAYQVRCDDIICYLAENGLGSVAVGKTVYSDTNLTIEYKTIKTVYEVIQDETIGYTDIQGNKEEFVTYGSFVYSDTKMTQIITESTGEDFKYTGNTKADYNFEYTGYVDKEVSILELKDSENREIKPNFICTYDNRIFGTIDNRLHCSMQQNIFDWASGDTDKPTSAYYIEFSKDITAITPYLGSSLAVFFKDSSLLVKGSYPEIQVTEESAGGCANYKSLVFHGTDLYFYDDTKKGIYSFQQVVLGNKTLGKDIALEVNDILNVIDNSQIEDMKALSYVADDRNEIWFLLPTSDKNYSTILIYDSLRDEWIKRKSKKIYSLATVNNILLSGGTKLYQEYLGNDFDGEFIQNYYNCTPFNLGSNTSMKILYLRPRMSVTFPYINEFWVKYAKNFDNFKTPKIKKVKSKFKNYMIWGQGKWGVNYWAGGTTNSILKLPNVSAFKTLNISFYTENSNENFAIRNMEMNQIDSIQT